MNERQDRLGPIETAIRDRNRAALMEALRPRTARQSESGCLRWTGAHRPNGYGMVGRAETNRLVHRLVAWAHAGFPDEMRTFPDVHHTCGVRDCVAPAHLKPVTAYVNVLEMRVRNALLSQLAEYRDVVHKLDPAHPILQRPEPTETAVELRPGRGFETPAERLRKREAALLREQASKEREQRRFKQVLEVRRLRAAGLTEREALAEVGIHRRVYQQWADRLDAWLEEDLS